MCLCENIVRTGPNTNMPSIYALLYCIRYSSQSSLQSLAHMAFVGAIVLAVMLLSSALAASVAPAVADTDYAGEYAFPAAVSDELESRHSVPTGVMYYADGADGDDADISTPLQNSLISSSSGFGSNSEDNNNSNTSDDRLTDDAAAAADYAASVLGQAARRKGPAVKRSKLTRAASANPSFMRFGRAGKHSLDGFLRYGRSGPNFIRFGRSHSTPNFLRFGRSGGSNDVPATADVLRFGRRGDNFIRFGKRDGGGGGADGEAELLPMLPVRALRASDEHDQRQLLVAPRADGTVDEKGMNAMLRLANEMNRFERNGKDFIRFGRGDDGLPALGGKQKQQSTSGIISEKNGRPSEHFG